MVALVQLSVPLVLSLKETASTKSIPMLVSSAADVLTDVPQKLLHRLN